MSFTIIVDNVASLNDIKSEADLRDFIWRNIICLENRKLPYEIDSLTEIREIFCSVIGLDSFDDDYFKTTVERMVVLDTGSIDFYLKDGTVRKFETLKLRNNLHETTSTDEFTGKIICSCCGNEYHRYCGRGKYVYWRCAGKSKVRTVCANQDYADFNLRKVTAYIMGTSDFNKNAFTEQVDHISVSADGLEYHFKDGRIESWRKR